MPADSVPPGLYCIAEPQTEELVVKLHRYNDPEHYLGQSRWVNLDGTSDMTPQKVYAASVMFEP